MELVGLNMRTLEEALPKAFASVQLTEVVAYNPWSMNTSTVTNLKQAEFRIENYGKETHTGVSWNINAWLTVSLLKIYFMQSTLYQRSMAET